ncbi:MAG: isoamylase early set domain-containing protein [Chloroflexota bacterium]|nr:isoamylase early set domain-containing protein [Chloroflexota bacterium]
MIEKRFIEKDGEQIARVTFTLPNSMWADMIYLVGDFNNWDERSHPMERPRQGGWSLTVDLEVGCSYQFRYLREGTEWMNDPEADAYVHNIYGSDNFVVVTDPDFDPHPDK